MHDFKKIMCVIDPSSKNQPAMQRGAWLAKRSGANLELFACYYNEYLSGERLFDSPSLRKARAEVIEGLGKRLEEYAQPMRDAGMTVTTKAVWDHPLHEGIVRQATAINADLVFKDTHHHSALSRTLLTNTDWNLIRTCAAPLWLVKDREMSKEPVFIAAIDPMSENDKPAALDDEILMTCKALADSLGGSVNAFHAYDPRVAVATATANAYIPVSLPFDEIETQIREQHEKRFAEVTGFHGIKSANLHLVPGLTHEELPAIAKKLDAGVVVMGAVSRNRWKRLFIGATAERTLEHLPCDLLVVKPDWFHVPAEISSERAA